MTGREPQEIDVGVRTIRESGRPPGSGPVPRRTRRRGDTSCGGRPRLGRQDMAAELIDAERSGLSHRVGKAPWHPIGHRGRGGTILQWTVGFNSYPHQAAAAKGHSDLFHASIDAALLESTRRR
jgi:hypothetical protein